MSLLDVRHQQSAQQTLQQAVGRGRVPHAYIFHGPDGVGKESLARGFAQLLLCAEPVEHALTAFECDVLAAGSMRIGCGSCRECTHVAAGTHPDYHVVCRELHREHPDPRIRNLSGAQLSIEVVREFLIRRVGLRAAQANAKVFVIREADTLNKDSQNALLKTFEEPPPGTYLILLVEAIDRLLPTMLSRCQTVSFGVLPAAFVAERLAALRPDVPDGPRAWYARASEGSLGRALTWIEDGMIDVNASIVGGLMSLTPGSIHETVQAWTDAAKALGQPLRKRDPELTDAESRRRALGAILAMAAALFDDVLRTAAGAGSEPINAEHRKGIETLGTRLGADAAAEAIDAIADARTRLIQHYLNTQLVIETLLGQLCHVVHPVAKAV